VAIHDYDSALALLLERINYERTSRIPYRTTEFRLDRMRELLRRLGDPHLRVPIVHVAGTKGKGSTATMIAAIFQAAGYRTGLYTSPHLERIEERFTINGRHCSADEFVELVRSVEATLRELDAVADDARLRIPTFFEITTAMAFQHFVQRQVDIAVLEVGLGGRLDSTNVCQPCVSVITSISFDHTRQLGNTLAAIAREKAGIIKPSVPVVSGVVSREPRAEIRHAAARQQAQLWERGEHFDVQIVASHALMSGPGIHYSDELGDTTWQLTDVAINLLGRHQADNAATAIAAARVLGLQGWRVPETAIRAGLSGVQCPARIEVLRRQPTVVLDTAHNVASIEALCHTLQDTESPRRVLIFAASRDKDAAGMLRLLLPQFDDIVFTRFLKNPRARPVAELRRISEQESNRLGLTPRIHDTQEPHAAWRQANYLAGEEGLICIAGSFFLAAELRSVATAQ
jgi:dihydrofolate synthase/folylpolyglutamate synthase